MLSFVVAGLVCVFAALCYAEFASMVPVAGSAYTYAYATLGELFAWIIGWDLVLEYAVELRDRGGRVVRLLPERPQRLRLEAARTPSPEPVVELRPAARQAGRHRVVHQPAGGLIVALVTVVLVIGIRESASFNTAWWSSSSPLSCS